MIRRYTVLSKSGLYDGWASSLPEMKEKFYQQIGVEDCFIFYYGSEPHNLNFEQWAFVLGECNQDVKQAHIIDRLFGKIYSIVKMGEDDYASGADSMATRFKEMAEIPKKG